MKKAKFGVILFIVPVLLFFSFVVQKNEKNNISKIESYYINDNNIKELIQIGMRKPMPKIVDVIVDESEIVALCEDGSVWSWEKGKDKNTAAQIPNLNDIKKIVYAGSAMYALSEDGYVYAWGSNEWLWIDAKEDRNKIFEEARRFAGLSDIVDIDACIDADSPDRVRAFAIDKSGNFYMWGIYLYVEEKKDYEPGFPTEYMELVQGVDKVFAGAGGYHYFIREDGTVFSILEYSHWRSNYINDFIFPSFPIETGDFQINNKPLHLSEICYVNLWEGIKYGFTILYELGQGESIQYIDADKYTVFLSDRGGLWYWDSKMIKFHDCKDAIADPERYQEDYAGNWKSVNIKEILGRENENGYAPYIVKICAGSENVFFLTNDGQVFMSEYITNAVEDVDYYNNISTNPNRERILTATDLNLKTITFHKMDWEDIISINTDGTHFFSAVDKDGRYYYFSAEL